MSTEVTAASFDESLGRWRVRTTAGEELFDVVVSAVGQLNRPRMPDITGTSDFKGVSFHSARWDHSQDLTGRRVAVIGNGSSAAQFIPRVAEVAGQVDVFQRTPNWVIPKTDATFGDTLTTAFRCVPSLQRGYREWTYRYTEGALYPGPGGGLEHRASAQNRSGPPSRPGPRPRTAGQAHPWLPDRLQEDRHRQRVLSRADPAERERRHRPDHPDRPGGVETATGLHEADMIVYATGFHASDFLAPMEITGREGRRLDEEWKDGAEAYLGIAVPRFPNLFMVYGPNTNLGHSSIVFMIECQVGYIMCCLPYIAGRGRWRSGRRRWTPGGGASIGPWVK